MLLHRINLGKFAVVVFLTILIWVWSDLALDESLEVQNVKITVAKSTDPSLWASFDGRESATIETIVLRGPTAKITDIRRRLHGRGMSFDTFFVPQQEGMTESGRYTLNVADFLKRADAIRQEGLSVESAEPRVLEVRVEKLLEKPLAIECVDENGLLVEAESFEPPTVRAYVPAEAVVKARIRLSRREIEQARLEPLPKEPTVAFGSEPARPTGATIRVKLPAAQERLRPYTITTATVGFALSENLQARHEVQLTNRSDLATVLIKATPEARQAYERQPFQMILNILDDDKPGEELRRPVEYVLPEPFVRQGDIILDQPKTAARFTLVPLPQIEP